MSKEITNYPASIHQQLLNRAKTINRPFNELLQYYAIERFLYRLGQSKYEEKVILKGAMLFIVWHASYSRVTKDIDILGYTENNVGNVVGIIKSVTEIGEKADGMVYDPVSVHGEQIIEDGSYKGVRVKFNGYLGNAKIPMQIDFGFGDVVFPKPQKIDYPTMLEMPAPELRGYPRETVIAEKFHVMVDKGLPNSRMKDFYDIWLLADQFDFESKTLGEAIQKTFKNRNMDIQLNPAALTEEFGANEDKNIQWKAFIKKQNLEHAPKEFKSAAKKIREFIQPVIKAILENHGKERVWKAPGPWK